MKIIFDIMAMGGGAPKSQIQHMQVFCANGHEVVATIGPRDFQKFKKLYPDISVHEVPIFSTLNLGRNIAAYRAWRRVLDAEKPDLVYANRVAQLRILSVVSDMTGVPFVYAQAGGDVPAGTLWPINDRISVCYSMENRQRFVDAGTAIENVSVISNRIRPYDAIEANYNDGTTTVLLVGNIKPQTINGYLALFEKVTQHGRKLDGVRFRIAGKKTTNLTVPVSDKFDNALERMNSAGLTVEHLGWVESMAELYQCADIVIGKGRSVIEPALHGKTCFVLNEVGHLIHVNTQNYEDLRAYNFSGRNFTEDDLDEFLILAEDKKRKKKERKVDNLVSELVRKDYHVNGAYDKLLTVFEAAINQAKQRQHQGLTVGLVRLFRVYLGALHNAVFHRKVT